MTHTLKVDQLFAKLLRILKGTYMHQVNVYLKTFFKKKN